MTTSRQRSGSSEGEGGDARFVFDADAADRACMFIERLLCHWQGEFAGQPFILLPWQRDAVVRPLFGWKRPDGTRRYRRVSVWVAKKNGKTPLGAAIALTVLFTDDEPGAEIYSVAADREQAAIVYGDGQAMVEQKRALRKRCRVLRRSILRPDTRSVWRVMSSEAKTKHGYRPHCVLFDELHAQADRELWDTMVLGVASRRQPLVISLSTAGIYNPESIAWEEYQYAKNVRDGVIPDDTCLPVIFEASPKDDWTDPEVWAKANPSLGVTIKREYLESECQKAREVPAKQSAFKRLHLNIWEQVRETVIPMQAWDACDALPIAPTGSACYIGLDLSAKIDLTAAVAIFPHEDNVYSVVSQFWLPEENLQERARRAGAPYKLWAEQGLLTLTPGNTVDQEVVRKWIKATARIHKVVEIAYDPWNATQISGELQNTDGFKVIEMRQGTKTMNDPTRTMVGLIADRKLRHGGHAVLRWNASNFAVRKDANDNWAPAKGKGSSKIDGIVALIMALDRALRHGQKGKVINPSVGFL